MLITGRQLEHWHTGSMTRRSSTVLDAIEPMATASLHGDELARLGVQPGRWWASARAAVGAGARAPRRRHAARHGVHAVCLRGAAANLLTNAALDPFGKIPGFKYCAVAVQALPSTRAIEEQGAGVWQRLCMAGAATDVQSQPMTERPYTRCLL